MRLRQHLERIRKHDLVGGHGAATAVVAAAAVVVAVVATDDVAVAGTSVCHGDVGPRQHRRCRRTGPLLR